MTSTNPALRVALPHLPGDQAPLYSQTATDDRGNFAYSGDLLRSSEPFPALCARIDTHLGNYFPDLLFVVTRNSFSGGRKISIEICDTPQDLRDRYVREALIVALRDQIERFGFTQTNFYQDYMSVSFFNEVTIGRSYWAALAARTEKQNPVEQRMSLSLFKRTIKPGDSLRLIHAPWDGRHLNVDRTVDTVRSSDIIIAGSYLTLPRAAAFACDGRLVRIAMGTEADPDAHLLYLWSRQSG